MAQCDAIENGYSTQARTVPPARQLLRRRVMQHGERFPNASVSCIVTSTASSAAALSCVSRRLSRAGERGEEMREERGGEMSRMEEWREGKRGKKRRWEERRREKNDERRGEGRRREGRERRREARGDGRRDGASSRLAAPSMASLCPVRPTRTARRRCCRWSGRRGSARLQHAQCTPPLKNTPINPRFHPSFLFLERCAGRTPLEPQSQLRVKHPGSLKHEGWKGGLTGVF